MEDSRRLLGPSQESGGSSAEACCSMNSILAMSSHLSKQSVRGLLSPG